MKISYVILHYNTIEDTKKCIDSVLNISKNSRQIDVSIIIVDNCSTNGSGERLKELYKQENITILHSDRNLGFARGNNIGYKYALKNNNPDYIILSNNDIEINQKNFFEKIIEIDNEIGFDVCGPDIFAPYKQVHQNPLKVDGYTKEDIQKLIKWNKRQIVIFNVLKYTKTYYIMHKIKKLLSKGEEKNILFEKENIDVILHGAFLILGKRYFKEFPNGLYPKTFMYMEEAILYYLCKLKNLKLLYSPQIKVLHYEGSATRDKENSRVDKSLFEFRNTLDSANIFLDLMEKQNERKN